ncbi:MAG TPA: hypothetical protein PLS19_12520, partial [bacterium]|nr:hypothetical protein [bacterium]
MRIRTTALFAASLAVLMCVAQPPQAAFAQSETPAQEETVVTETAGAAEEAAQTQAAEEASEQTEAPPDLIELGDIKLSGYRKVKWRDYSSSGDFEMFRSANGFSYRDARFEQTSFIMLKGDLPR